MLVQFKQTADIIEGSAAADLLINYNNIDKVDWERETSRNFASYAWFNFSIYL